MSKIRLILLLALTFTSMEGLCQNSNRQHYAEKVTIKIRDSLSLSSEQTVDVFKINKRIEMAKDSAWIQFTNENAIRAALQAVENTRDSLYKTVFTNEQFALYQEKKVQLISNK